MIIHTQYVESGAQAEWLEVSAEVRRVKGGITEAENQDNQ